MRRGFTLTELLVAAAISMAVIGTAFGVFLSQTMLYRRQRQINEMQQAVRTAADMVARDVRQAGYGLPVPAATLPQWITWVTGMTNAVVLANGSGTSPDTLSLAAAFEPPAATLSAAAPVGAVSIPILGGGGMPFNTTTRKLIFIGRQELARVTGISGANLIVSTLPTTSRGLRYAYPAGTPIELVQVVTYACNPNPTGYPRRPYLTRDDNTGAFTNGVQKLAAVGIENLQATLGTNTVTLAFTGRTALPDATYRHPTFGDSYRRSTWSAVIKRRN